MEMRDLLKKEFHLEEEPDTFECTRDSQQDNKITERSEVYLSTSM